MTLALLSIVYLAIGQWIAIAIGRETHGHDIAACALIWLPAFAWAAVRRLVQRVREAT